MGYWIEIGEEGNLFSHRNGMEWIRVDKVSAEVGLRYSRGLACDTHLTNMCLCMCERESLLHFTYPRAVGVDVGLSLDIVTVSQIIYYLFETDRFLVQYVYVARLEEVFVRALLGAVEVRRRMLSSFSIFQALFVLLSCFTLLRFYLALFLPCFVLPCFVLPCFIGSVVAK